MLNRLQSSKKIIFRLILNSLLGLVLIFIWAQFVNLSDIFHNLARVKPQVVFFFFGLFCLSGLFRSIRLKLLLNHNKLDLKDLLMLNFLSQFLSFMIPIRAGEISKSVYLTSQLNIPLGKTIVWVFIDRFLDLWVFLLTIALLLPVIPTTLPSTFVKTIFLLLGLLLLLVILAIKSENFMKKMTQVLSTFLIISTVKRRFVLFTHTIIEGFSILRRHPLELVGLVGLTVLAILSDGLIWMAVFSSLGIETSLINFGRSTLGNSMEAFSFLIPAAPGYVGSAEAAGLAVFGGILGLPPNLASSGLVLFHILTLATIFILGLSSLYFLKFDLGTVWKKLKGKD
ncbi:flippase-like domain-containing protein [Candidatus Daviesbacteria bacterium]|nr:flippase-like domain-containing protein [Candidatus Daviesbacteria bacterium]